MKNLRASLLLAFSTLLAADAILAPWSGPELQLDGKIQEAGWQGPQITDFKQLESEKKEKQPDTRFLLRTTPEALLIGVNCDEPNMAKLDLNAPIWTGDGIEFFCCPSGKPDEFYQFRLNANGLFYAMFYAEAGNITPDPYAPLWEHAVSRRADGWSAEIRIPWHAFYMTSASNWKTQWLLNCARERRFPRNCTSWAPVRNNYNDATKFPKVSGFPPKQANQDILINPATIKISQGTPKGYTGTLDVNISAGAPGKYLLEGATPLPQIITLKEGLNQLLIPQVTFPALGRNPLTLKLFSEKKKLVAQRSCQVVVEFEALSVKLSTPAYRNHFYPGQDSSKISGVATTALIHPLTLELQLDQGSKTKFTFLGNSAPFILDSSKMTEGSHTLRAKVTTKEGLITEKSLTIQKFNSLPKDKMGAWVSNGLIVINGKPAIPRFIYAHGWHSGTALNQRADKDDLGLTGILQQYQISIDPSRLAAKIMQKENLTQDVKPGQEVFDVLRSRIERNRNKNFLYYLLFDEPECTSTSPVYLRYLYDFVKELDPWHPILIPTREPLRYLDCADILVPHPYINPAFDGQGKRSLSKPMYKIRDYILPAKGNPDKVLGLTGQFFSYKSSSVFSDYPTFEELEGQVWTTIANGGRWFNNYAYHDLGDRPVLYEGTRYLFTSLRALESLLSTAKTLPLTATAPSGNKFDAVLFQNGKDYLLLLVNLLPESQKIAVQSSELQKIPRWYLFRENRQLPGKQTKLEFTLPPHGTILLSSVVLDKGLPTRQEVIQKITRLEQQRLSRPNILLGKGLDLEISSSVSTRSTLNWQNKLFDGTLDVWAWAHQDFNAKPYLEFSFPKFVPQFRKIRLFGTPLSEKTCFTIRKRGTWKPCVPSKITRHGDYEMEFEFSETLSTIRLKIDFPELQNNNILEIYEVEME